MTPYKMLLVHNPAAGVYGDCVRTVFASMLDVEPATVPHFFRDGADRTAGEQWQEIYDYLATQGLSIVEILIGMPAELDDILKSIGERNPDIYYIVAGRSTIADHFVIALNDEIVMDPSHLNNGLVGPSSLGYYHIFFLVPYGIHHKKHG